MIEQEIVDYIIKAQKHGLSDVEIKQNLLNVGWEAAMVEESFVFSRAAENKANFADTGGPKPTHQATPSTFAHTQVAAAQAAVTNKSAPVNFPSSTRTLSDQHFQITTVKSSSFFKKPLFWIIFIILLLAGGASFGYYKYIYATPTTVWSKFLTTKINPIFKTNYLISYSDPTFKNPKTNIVAPVAISLKGQSKIDFSDTKTPKSDMNTALDIKSGSTEANFGLNYLILGKVLYVDVGQVQVLKSLFPDPNTEWLKVDFDELQKYIQDNSKNSTSTNELTPELKARLNDIWTKAAIIKPSNYLNKETLDNSQTYHLKLDFNSQAFKSAVIDSIVAIQATESDDEPKMNDDQKQALGAFLEKTTTNEFEIWIDQKNYQLHKLNLAFKLPTFDDVYNSSFTTAIPAFATEKAKVRDAQRLADVKQIQSGLELYFGEKGGYPTADNNGQPKNFEPNYITKLPTAPTPADGSCTDYYNPYWYTPDGKAKVVKGETVYSSYSITFCLGNDTGGYNAGIAKITPDGISANITCPSTVQNCMNTTKPASINVADTINQMSFGAELKIELTNSDFGKSFDIKAPDSSTNLIDLIKSLEADKNK